jgi:hypothetical protein
MFRPTLLIDEVDAFLKDNEEMRSILNSSYHPRGNIIRMVGNNHEPRFYSVWAAVALAGIGDLPTTVKDRSITIPLRRRLPSDGPVERLWFGLDHLKELARQIVRWVADNHDRIERDPPALPEELSDRQQDNWRSMIAIADAMGEEIGAAARKTALALNLERDYDDNDIALLALKDVHAIFESAADSMTLSAQYLVDELAKMDDRPWPTWRRDKPITQNSLKRLLTPFGVKSKQIKVHGGKGYERAPVAEAFARYCTVKPEEEIEVNDPM